MQYEVYFKRTDDAPYSGDKLAARTTMEANYGENNSLKGLGHSIPPALLLRAETVAELLREHSKPKGDLPRHPD